MILSRVCPSTVTLSAGTSALSPLTGTWATCTFGSSVGGLGVNDVPMLLMLFCILCASGVSPLHNSLVLARAGEEPVAGSPITTHASFGCPLTTAVTHAATAASGVG